MVTAGLANYGDSGADGGRRGSVTCFGGGGWCSGGEVDVRFGRGRCG